MREIKFRAWDKEQRVITFRIGCYTDGPEITELNDNITSCEKDYILMQYTGLMDKNRKEIYEGDIINIRSNRDGDIIYTDEVTFFEGCFVVNQGEPINSWCSECIEVIGNIYENNELLN